MLQILFSIDCKHFLLAILLIQINYCMYFRLRKISEEVSVPILQTRRRSNSLPIPQIEISVYQGTNSNSRDSPSGNTLKDFIEVPEQVMANVINDCSDSTDSKSQQRTEKVTGTIERRANSERKRNVKIASFKSLIESKIFSKSEKELERIGLCKKPPATDTTSCISQDDTDAVSGEKKKSNLFSMNASYSLN